MSDSILHQVYSGGGYYTPGGNGSSGVAAAVAAPVDAVTRLGQVSQHLTLMGVIALLVFLWVLVRVAGFRFVVMTGIGR